MFKKYSGYFHNNIKSKITEIIRKRRLTWFGHICRREINSLVAKAYHEDFSNPRPKGRPSLRWSDQIRTDTGLPLLTAKRKAMDRKAWKSYVIKKCCEGS